jgi:hypothetical protein
MAAWQLCFWTMASDTRTIENPDTAADSEGIAMDPVSAEPATRSAVANGVAETEARAGAVHEDRVGEPARLYLPGCGALCDIFWWARRSS